MSDVIERVKVSLAANERVIGNANPVVAAFAESEARYLRCILRTAKLLDNADWANSVPDGLTVSNGTLRGCFEKIIAEELFSE